MPKRMSSEQFDNVFRRIFPHGFGLIDPGLEPMSDEDGEWFAQAMGEMGEMPNE